MMILLFVAALLGLGVALCVPCRPDAGPPELSMGSAFDALVGGILGVSLLAVILLQIGVFGIGRLTILALVVALGLVIVARCWPRFRVRLRIGRSHVLLACILLLALFLRVPPYNWVVGGQDPGVYVNVANHIRRTGTVFMTDDLLRTTGNAARDVYVRDSYYFTSPVAPSCDEGVYTPGIYVQDLANGLLVPQFYHLHPLWLAISGSLFGQQRATALLPVFGLLSIVLVFRLTNLLASDQFAALAAALLLAVNPLHSYMSKFPVSEVPTAFFFLSGVYFLTRLLKTQGADRVNGVMAVLSFGCVFFTRISGFLYVPVVLGFLAYALIAVFPRPRRLAIALCVAGILAAYAYSVWHGYHYSCAYARSIYQAYFHTDFTTWPAQATVALLAAVVLATCGALHRCRRPVLRSFARLRPWRSHLAVLALGCVLGLSMLSAYRFVSSPNSYGPSLASLGIDPVTSPKVAGMDLAALSMLNWTVLNLLLTPVAVAAALAGLYLLLRRSLSQPYRFLCGALTLYFLAVNTVALVNARYLYYYGRYLLSETIPLLLIAAAMAVGQMHRNWPRAALLVLLGAAAPPLALSYLHTRDAEMKHFYADLEGITAELDDGAVVLVDRAIVPEWRRIAAPLKMSFDVTPFWFHRADLEQGRLDEVLRILLASNRNVFALTNDDALATEYFAPYRRLPVRLNRLGATWLSIPIGFVVERDTLVTIYRPTERLQELAAGLHGNSAWSAQHFE